MSPPTFDLWPSADPPASSAVVMKCSVQKCNVSLSKTVFSFQGSAGEYLNPLPAFYGFVILFFSGVASGLAARLATRLATRLAARLADLIGGFQCLRSNLMTVAGALTSFPLAFPTFYRADISFLPILPSFPPFASILFLLCRVQLGMIALSAPTSVSLLPTAEKTDPSLRSQPLASF